MKRIKFIIPFIAFVFIGMYSCSDDDDGVIVVPPRERDEESIAAQEEIEEFLQTHFYNYEEFENPPADFDYKIEFGKIEGDNADKIPLMTQVESKEVVDLVDENVTYKFYFLRVRQGEGDEISYADVVTLSYEGRYMTDLSLFDSRNFPVPFDLTQSIQGFQQGVIEFNGATGFEEIGDGTLEFFNYGIGAAFIPSGMGYFNTPPSGSDIPFYSQLVFTFSPYIVEKGDQDGDGILSIYEDLNGDGLIYNDNTDGDISPNFSDADDDNDGRLTKDENVNKEYSLEPGDVDPVYEENEMEMYRETDEETGNITIYTVVFTDANGDGTPDYLDDNL